MKKTVALFLVFICILGMVGCNKAKYTVEIADNYPIANRLKPNYAAGEEVTVKLETITEHYYVLSVNGDEVEMDRDTSDLTYTYFTFTMPGEDVLIQIADKWVEIPPLSPSPVDQCSPITLTIVETEPSGVAFEYREPNTPYCFYAFDEDENLYRVLWTDWDGLREKDRVIVEYEKLEELTYDEYPDGGWTPQYELTATGVNTSSCISNEQGVYVLTLPSSGEKITLKDDFTPFVPYIADALVVAAEKKITADIAEYSNSSGFYLQISEDYLCLVREVIHYIDPPETAGEYTLSGCGIDHEHLFFSERISLCPISTQRNASDNSI